MKNSLIIFITSLIISGCSVGNNDNRENPVNDKEIKYAEQKEVNNKQSASKKEDEDGILENPGEFVYDELGRVELIKSKSVDEVVKAGPININLGNIKFFKLTELTEKGKEKLGKQEEVYYIQVTSALENTVEKNIAFNGLNIVVLSDGQQINVPLNDFNVSEDDFDNVFYGMVKKDAVEWLVVKGNPTEIKNVKLIFSGAYDPDTLEEISKKQQVTYSF